MNGVARLRISMQDHVTKATSCREAHPTGGMAYPETLVRFSSPQVFIGYVLFDTQVIVEQAFAGNLDHVRLTPLSHELLLFYESHLQTYRIISRCGATDYGVSSSVSSGPTC